MRFKSTTAERYEARRLQAEGAALLTEYVSTHRCEKNPGMCTICAPAELARWAERAQRDGPRRATRIDFRVSDVVKNLSY